jgi:antitoxin FitA
MSSLIIPDLKDDALARLRDRAAASGRSVEEEAKVVLESAMQVGCKTAWESVTAIRDRLSASGRWFGDSAELIREDRER